MNRRQALYSIGATAGLGALAGMADRTAVVGATERQSARLQVQFQKGSIVRLVLKDAQPGELADGALLWHEHPVGTGMVSPPGASMTDEQRLTLVLSELKAARAEGVGCMFATTHTQWSPRQLRYIQELAQRSDLPLGICGARDATGPTADPWWKDAKEKGERRAVDELAERMYQESVAERWAALGEIATWDVPLSEPERWYIKAIARVQLRTNLRVYTHTPMEGCPSCAVEQLDLFESQGVDPRHLCIGHLSFVNNSGLDSSWATHKTIARRGAFIGFDNFGVPLSGAFARYNTPFETRIRMVLQLLDAGYEDRILFSSDTWAAADLKANNGPGFSSLVTMLVPRLRAAGVSDALIEKMTVDNPRRFFAFVPRSA